jgi:hypothetical protein
MTSMSPADGALFWKGYMEVPVKLPNNGPAAIGPQGPMHGPMEMEGMPTEQVVPGEPVMPETPDPPAASESPSAANGSSRRTSTASAAVPRQQAPVYGASSRRTAQAPAWNTPYNQTTPQTPKSSTQPNGQSGPPGFIGPRGYDVSN